MRILLTGGSGLLGGHILAIAGEGVAAPNFDELDILNPQDIFDAIGRYKPDCVLHLAAKTTPLLHESRPEVGIETNIIGTANVALACVKMNKRLVYTSTDYVYTGPGPHLENEPLLPPYNFGWSKLGGECSVRMVPNHLILRLSFGPRPFPWENVYAGQKNSKLYVDEIAPLILAAARSDITGVLNLGGAATTLEEYAKRTMPDVGVINKPDWVPADTSLDLTRMNTELHV